MHYWHAILNEVLFSHQNEKNSVNVLISKNFPTKEIESRDLRTYYLGDNYPGVYFTKREAECIFWMAQDFTIAETALKIGLSARTVEFYVKNMKLKLQCSNKKKLIEKVLYSDLLQALEKDGMRIVKH